MERGVSGRSVKQVSCDLVSSPPSTEFSIRGATVIAQMLPLRRFTSSRLRLCLLGAA